MKITNKVKNLLENKVVGSAGSLDDLVDLMKKKLYWSKVDLEEIEKDKLWYASNAKYKNLAEIKKKGNRYQLFWSDKKELI